jgi:Glutaredoxin-like domain (DUF836)
LMVRGGCRMCEVAREAMVRVAAGTGESWVEVDVAGDPVLEDEYGLRVPVVLLDGKEHGYWKVEEDRLIRDLARSAGGGR